MKKPTGLERHDQEVKETVAKAKTEFLDLINSLRAKKEEKIMMKAGYEEERKIRKEEDKLERQFKFTKGMSRKKPFFPSLSSKGNFVE